MSSLKYKSSNTSTNNSNSSNQPIWCSLTTPSQIARKYASIAPIWCHISRPRQLKKKFASTLHQAQNLLTRQHSRENNALSNSGSVSGTSTTASNGIGTTPASSNYHTNYYPNGNGYTNHHTPSYQHHYNDLDEDQLNELNTYKNTTANANTSNWTPSVTMASDSSSSAGTTMGSRKIGDSSSSKTHHDSNDYDYDLTARLSLRKRDSSLDNRPFSRKATENR